MDGGKREKGGRKGEREKGRIRGHISHNEKGKGEMKKRKREKRERKKKGGGNLIIITGIILPHFPKV